MDLIDFLIIYLVLINLYGFIIMFVDKRYAIKNKWRIPERRFFIVSLLLGSLGSFLGMQVFRHKTKHWYFKYGIPAILIIQLGALAYFLANK